MNQAIESMLAKYQLQTGDDYQLALHEIIQEIALLGLYRSDFFKVAAFYGGTALRMLYDLDRFSEDLDFSLLVADENFSLQPFFTTLKEELSFYAFDVEVSSRDKGRTGVIESAFIKANTRKLLLKIQAPDDVAALLPDNQKLKIKFEVDTNPPPGFNTETKFILEPTEFTVNAFDLPSLFAGKMHAVLCRNWQNRVKGRDWYDFIWYVRRQTKLNLEHLSQRMLQSGHIKAALNEASFRQSLKKRIDQVDFNEAREEVSRFVKEPARLELWSTDFFLNVAEKVII